MHIFFLLIAPLLLVLIVPFVICVSVGGLTEEQKKH